MRAFNRPPEGPIEQSLLYRLLEQQVFKPVFWHPPSATSVRSALLALMAAFPVCRTYVDAHHSTREDRAILTHAVEQARD